MEVEPKTETLKAMDIKPHHWALWCQVAGGEPHANPICSRKWSEDGTRIWFMLDSHNFFAAAPEDDVEGLLPYLAGNEILRARWDLEDAIKMSKRPCAHEKCPHCGGTGMIQKAGA